MRSFAFTLFFTSLCLISRGQNVILGTNGFLTHQILTDYQGFGFNVRMGVELLQSEMGIKSHYGRLESLESYGVSLYSFVPVLKHNKWEVMGHVEGGFAFVYSSWNGSERSIFMGIGPSLRYHIREYLQLELTVEYTVFSNIATEEPLYTQLIIPTIGWSVRI